MMLLGLAGLGFAGYRRVAAMRGPDGSYREVVLRLASAGNQTAIEAALRDLR